MDYSEQISWFWARHQTKAIGAAAIGLYISLVNKSESKGWINPILFDIEETRLSVGLSAATIYSLLSELNEKGYIAYVKGSKHTPATIRFSSFAQTGFKTPDAKAKEGMVKKLKPETIQLMKDNIELIDQNLSQWIANHRNGASASIQDASISSQAPENRMPQFGAITKKHVKEFEADLYSSDKLMELSELKHKMSKKETQAMLKVFIIEQQTKDAQYKSAADVMSHFIAWMGKKTTISTITTDAEKNSNKPTVGKSSHEVIW